MKKWIFWLVNELKKANKKPDNIFTFSLGIFLMGAFWILLYLEAGRFLGQFDQQSTIFLQNLIPRNLDIYLSIFSLLGSFEITSLVVFAIAIFLLKKEKRVYFPLVFFGVILVFEFIGKLGVYHPGPPGDFFRYTLPFSFPTSHVSTNGSFPSGHVSRTIYLLIVLSFLTLKYAAKKYRLVYVSIYIVISIIMVVSRVYLGEHWASDTIGGILLGLTTGLLTISYYNYATKN